MLACLSLHLQYFPTQLLNLPGKPLFAWLHFNPACAIRGMPMAWKALCTLCLSPSEFLMPCLCIFRESLDHLVTKGVKDLLDHLVTR